MIGERRPCEEEEMLIVFIRGPYESWNHGRELKLAELILKLCDILDYRELEKEILFKYPRI